MIVYIFLLSGGCRGDKSLQVRKHSIRDDDCVLQPHVTILLISPLLNNLEDSSRNILLYPNYARQDHALFVTHHKFVSFLLRFLIAVLHRGLSFAQGDFDLADSDAADQFGIF